MKVRISCTCGSSFEIELARLGSIPKHNKPVKRTWGVRADSPKVEYVMVDVLEPCPASDAQIQMVDGRYGT